MIAALLLFASTIDDGWPPLRYRRDASALVHFIAPGKISTFCDDAPNPIGFTTIACEDGFILWLPNPCTFPDGDEYARIVCHELSHVNGWSENHPGSRSRK